ncbi:MAG: hypothetical protein EBY25_03240 [Betaproteobacteria bacterium]|nr:hypothetical protein [Betaproteobacteria bacterium]
MHGGITVTVKIRDWPRTALVCGVLSLTLWASQAQALSLGRVVVGSLLGEPLRAEIDFLDISADEAATLSAAIASQDAFQAAGTSYSTIVSAIQVTVQKRADGQPFIRLMSSGAINDSFIDLVLEAKWSNGRLLRDYTLLFAQAKAGTSPKDASPDKAPKLGPDTVTVRSGDTAGAIALSLKPSGVSLDQMLVALLRANPGVFLGENVNRIQAGAVLVIPTAQQSAQTPAPLASRIIAAQSQDFNDFRRKFAAIAQATQIESQSRQSSGTVQAKLEDHGMDCWLASGRCAGCSGSNSRSSSRGSSSLSCTAAPAASSGRAWTSRSACARTGSGSGCVGSGRTTGGGSGCCSMGARAGRSTVSSAVRRASWSAAFWRMTRVSSGLPGPAGCTESTVFCRRWPRR